MTSHYRATLYTDDVKAEQAAQGSRSAMSGDDMAYPEPDLLTGPEAAFLQSRTSFYMATVNAGGWPYVQHRGGPAGFVRVIAGSHIAFADFPGNRQYLTTGNLRGSAKAAFFFMDYPNRARMKLIGRAEMVSLDDRPDLAPLGIDAKGRKVARRAVLVAVEAFDWNCSQHITPRFTADDLRPVIEDYERRIAALEAEIARLTQAGQAQP